MSGYTRPSPLTPAHVLDRFASGNDTLDSWLHRRALKNESSGASRTFVTCTTEPADAVVGYYTLAASAVALAQAPGPVRRNMPDPIPVVLLGRLAVDRRHQGAGLGASLLQDAVRRVVGVGHMIGVRALLVHAIDEPAAAFYRHFGFVESTLDEQTLFLPMETVRASVETAGP
ncbi:MAG: GNAT family N-acetyltransferase [Nocardioidaceae bacterium]